MTEQEIRRQAYQDSGLVVQEEGQWYCMTCGGVGMDVDTIEHHEECGLMRAVESAARRVADDDIAEDTLLDIMADLTVADAQAADDLAFDMFSAPDVESRAIIADQVMVFSPGFPSRLLLRTVISGLPTPASVKSFRRLLLFGKGMGAEMCGLPPEGDITLHV